MIICFGENTFAQLGIADTRRDHPYSHFPFAISKDTTLDHDAVADVQCGSKFSIVLDVAGRVSVCGTVNGINYPILTPVKISYPLKCVQLSCGRKHILALMEAGHVLSWGVGYFGQLGHGDDSSYDNAKLVQALEPNRLSSRVILVACGGSHSGVVTESGKVFTWGLNKQGQCGLGSKQPESITEPRPLDPDTMNGVKVTSLVCGRNHSAIVSTDGKVFTFGATSFGRLGTDRDSSTSGSAASKKAQCSPVEVRYFRNLPVHSLASGDFHMLALAHDCSVHSWGCGSDGQLGHRGSLENLTTPKKIGFFSSKGIGSKVVQIACGSGWSTAVTAAGGMYVWGQGDGGWLGIPPPPDMPILNEGEAPMISTSQAKSAGTSQSQSQSPLSAAASKREESQKVDQQQIKHSCSFDSRHNILVPDKINQHLISPNYVVERVRCGGSHTIVFLGHKTGGDTSVEEGEEGRPSPLSRGRNSSSDIKVNSDVQVGTKGAVAMDSLLGSKRSPPITPKNASSANSENLLAVPKL